MYSIFIIEKDYNYIYIDNQWRSDNLIYLCLKINFYSKNLSVPCHSIMKVILQSMFMINLKLFTNCFASYFILLGCSENADVEGKFKYRKFKF